MPPLSAHDKNRLTLHMRTHSAKFRRRPRDNCQRVQRLANRRHTVSTHNAVVRDIYLLTGCIQP